MSQIIAGRRIRHWAQINECSFVAGIYLLFWISRVFGRWPLRAALYPVVLWYMMTRPAGVFSTPPTACCAIRPPFMAATRHGSPSRGQARCRQCKEAAT